MAMPVHNGLQFVPTGTVGAPASGTWALGTVICDSTGQLFRCIVAGTPGTWLAIGPVDQTGGRQFQSTLSNHGTAFLLLTGVAYFVYVGQVVAAVTPKFVEVQVTTIGAGAQTAEVGLFSSPLGPNKAGQSLTKLTATGTVDALTALGVKRNTTAFTTPIAAGTHLWAGMRTAMATTQPTCIALGYDMAGGRILSTAAAGVLTGAGPFAGAIIAASAAQVCPDLRVTLD